MRFMRSSVQHKQKDLQAEVVIVTIVPSHPVGIWWECSLRCNTAKYVHQFARRVSFCVTDRQTDRETDWHWLIFPSLINSRRRYCCCDSRSYCIRRTV